jgi:hypothetical protein
VLLDIHSFLFHYFNIMKKIFTLILLLIIAVGVWLFLNKNKQASALPIKLNQLSVQSSITVTTAIVNGSPIYSPTNEVLNALTATNLSQWKSMIPGLKYSDNFGTWSSWIMEKRNLRDGDLVSLEGSGKTISYSVHFIDVRILSGSDRVRKVEMHSPMMNVDEIREFGSQLCQMIGVDSIGVSNWCDKVGHRWMDEPLYHGVGNGIYGFEILNSFDNDRPWYINFVIQQPL